MYKIGFNKYVKDAPLVYDRLVQNAKKFNLNENEVSNPPFGHAFQYLDSIILKMEKKNISIPKT